MGILTINRKRLIYYAILTGLLLIPPWYKWGHGFVIFIAFIPLLFVEDYIDENKKQYKSVSVFEYSFVSFFIWTAGTMWWLVNATVVGTIVAVIVNALLMGIVFWAFHYAKRYCGRQIGYFAFITFWVTFEHFYFNAEMSNPWLTLGHAFNYNTRLIQWYDTTGVLGGSLWVLTVNVLLFNIIKAYINQHSLRKLWGTIILAAIVIIAPVTISLIKYYTYKEVSNPRNIVIIQPNIDPYGKFISIPSRQQTQIQLELAARYTDDSTDYIVAPETSINNRIFIKWIDSIPDFKMIRGFMSGYPKLKYVVGIQCYKKHNPKDMLPANAIKLEAPHYLIIGGKKVDTILCYSSYNAAIQLDSTDYIPIYFKSQLVTGVEKMPYAKYLKFLEKLTVRLGGTFRGWGPQDYRDTFVSPQDSIRIAPVICWESVFGEYVTDYIKQGANYIFVITNDGWWGNTAGHHQHNALSCIRAIETRRSIARAANTGISCFINQRGDVLQKLGWWKRGALKGTINANDKLTFYVRHGDYLARIARFFALLVVLLVLVRIFISPSR
jgi:apolipoprotein N-acyltransferase